MGLVRLLEQLRSRRTDGSEDWQSGPEKTILWASLRFEAIRTVMVDGWIMLFVILSTTET